MRDPIPPDRVSPPEVPGQPGRSGRGRSWVWFLVGSVVSLGLLGLVSRSVDWQRMGSALEAAHLEFLALAFLLNQVAVLLQGWRWHTWLRTDQHSVGFVRAVVINHLSVFFDLFIPGKLGSDAFRFKVAAGDSHHVVGTLLAMRVQGLVVGGFVALTTTVVFVPGARVQILVVAGAVVGVALLLAVGVGGGISRLASGVTGGRGRRSPILGPVREVAFRFRAMVRHPGALAASTALTFGFVLLNALVFLCAGRAFGVDVSYLRFLWVSSVVLVVSGLPVTIHGRGVSEALAASWLAVGGISVEAAVLASLGKYAVTLAHGFSAGAVLAVGGMAGLRASRGDG